jgi:hypothetical protein
MKVIENFRVRLAAWMIVDLSNQWPDPVVPGGCITLHSVAA